MAAPSMHAISGPAQCRGVTPIGVDHVHIPEERTTAHRQECAQRGMVGRSRRQP